MNKNKLVKRTLAIVLSAAMVFTNIGHSPTVAYAASGNSVDFMVSGTDFVAAIEDMIHSGAEPLKQGSWILPMERQKSTISFSLMGRTRYMSSIRNLMVRIWRQK